MIPDPDIPRWWWLAQIDGMKARQAVTKQAR